MAEDLPSGWTVHKGKDGKTYYHHAASKKSVWSLPPKPAFQNDGSFMESIRALKKSEGGSVSLPSGGDGSSTWAANPDTQHSFTRDGATPAERGSSGDGKRKGASAAVDSEQRGPAEAAPKSSKAPRLKSGGDSSKPSAGASAASYLAEVEKLTRMDKQTDATGGKWLVR